MGEDPKDKELRETIAEVADTWHLFPEPSVLTTGGLSRAKGELEGVARTYAPRKRTPKGRNSRP